MTNFPVRRKVQLYVWQNTTYLVQSNKPIRTSRVLNPFNPCMKNLLLLQEMAIDPPKITLRPFDVTDVDDFMVYGADPRVSQCARWETFASEEEALTFIKEECIPHPWCRSICIDNRSIGFISVRPGSDEARYKADIGYAMSAKHWGQGLGTAALKMAVSSALKEFPGLLRLQAFVALENKASQRVLGKAGFIQEGLLRKYLFLKDKLWDMYIYSYLPTEPNTEVNCFAMPS